MLHKDSYFSFGLDFITVHQHTSLVSYGTTMVDCEQSLFFFRFSKGSARARERRSSETSETRAVAREERECLSHLAPSVTRVTICVSRVLLDGLQEKERLLVVYHDGDKINK